MGVLMKMKIACIFVFLFQDTASYAVKWNINQEKKIIERRFEDIFGLMIKCLSLKNQQNVGVFEQQQQLHLQEQSPKDKIDEIIETIDQLIQTTIQHLNALKDELVKDEADNAEQVSKLEDVIRFAIENTAREDYFLKVGKNIKNILEKINGGFTIEHSKEVKDQARDILKQYPETLQEHPELLYIFEEQKITGINFRPKQNPEDSQVQNNSFSSNTFDQQHGGEHVDEQIQQQKNDKEVIQNLRKSISSSMDKLQYIDLENHKETKKTLEEVQVLFACMVFCDTILPGHVEKNLTDQLEELERLMWPQALKVKGFFACAGVDFSGMPSYEYFKNILITNSRENVVLTYTVNAWSGQLNQFNRVFVFLKGSLQESLSGCKQWPDELIEQCKETNNIFALTLLQEVLLTNSNRQSLYTAFLKKQNKELMDQNKQLADGIIGQELDKTAYQEFSAQEIRILQGLNTGLQEYIEMINEKLKLIEKDMQRTIKESNTYQEKLEVSQKKIKVLTNKAKLLEEITHDLKEQQLQNMISPKNLKQDFSKDFAQDEEIGQQQMQQQMFASQIIMQKNQQKLSFFRKVKDSVFGSKQDNNILPQKNKQVRREEDSKEEQ